MPTRRRSRRSQRRRNARRNTKRINEKRVTRLAIFLRDDFRCCYCNLDLRHAPTGGITLDHVIPRSLAGKWCPENLVTACEFCNSQRGDQLLSQYAGMKTRERIFRQLNRSIEPYIYLAAATLGKKRHAG